MFSYHLKDVVYRKLKRVLQKLSFCFKWPDTGQHTVCRVIMGFEQELSSFRKIIFVFNFESHPSARPLLNFAKRQPFTGGESVNSNYTLNVRSQGKLRLRKHQNSQENKTNWFPEGPDIDLHFNGNKRLTGTNQNSRLGT